jgi:hypothetical protein
MIASDFNIPPASLLRMAYQGNIPRFVDISAQFLNPDCLSHAFTEMFDPRKTRSAPELPQQEKARAIQEDGVIFEAMWQPPRHAQR